MASEVVISGIGSCISKSTNVHEFQELLLNNLDTLGPARWAEGELNVCSKTHTIESIEGFDSTFFGMHRQQAKISSAFQRMMLERTYEALIDAGVHPAEIAGKNVAVFIGSEINEAGTALYDNESGFALTGQVCALMANRVSYFFNLNGPSYSEYANWNGGLQCLQQAVDAVASGQCEAALVGVCNLLFTSSIEWAMDKLGLLSPDGITRAFDAAASGYGRSEAIVALYIQRADLAKRHYATVLHTELAYNGNRSGGINDIRSTDFTEFLSNCYAKSGVNPDDVQYLETYGCGIKNIDELEMAAIEEVYCKNRPEPLLVGNVKSNVGHAEASSDFVSIVKVLVAMETGVIPATLHYNTPNPNITALTSGKVKIVTKNQVWNGGIVAINSIGYSSSLGHIILRSNPHRKTVQPTIDIPLLTVFSSRTEEGSKQIMNTINEQSNLEYTRLVHDVFTYPMSGFLYRGYTIQGSNPKSTIEACSGDKRPIWFIYSGMGSQWHTMGRDLMVIPIFAESIRKCHAVLQTKHMDLIKIITEDDMTIFDNILNSFVGISAIQIALTDLLRAMDIVPAGIIGHSVGELGCAYADGCLTAEEVILAAYYRGIVSLEANLDVGMMAAVGLGAKQIASICPPEIDIACHNSATSCTLSGPPPEMQAFVSNLKFKGIFAALVNVSNIAYHSRYIQPAGPLLLNYLNQLIKTPKKRTAKWISTSIPQTEWSTNIANRASAEYFTNNLLSPVYFEENACFIPDNAIAIEIGPHAILQSILKRSLEGVINIGLAKKYTNGLDSLLNALGRLYISGANFKVAALYPDISYPVSCGTRSTADLVQWNHAECWPVIGLVVAHKRQYEHFQISSNDEQFSYITEMQLDNRYVLPTSLFLGLVYQFMNKLKTVDNITFENVAIYDYECYGNTDTINVELGIHLGSGNFEVSIRDKVLVSGVVYTESLQSNLKMQLDDATVIQNEIQTSDFYKEFSDRGYTYSGRLKSVKSISITEKGIIGLIKWENDWILFLEAMLQIYCFHSGETEQNMLYPSYIRYLNISIENFPQDVKDLEVTFCSNTGIMNSSAVNICNVQFRPIEPVRKDLKIDYLKALKPDKATNSHNNISANEHLVVNITSKNYSFVDFKNQSKPWALQLVSALKYNGSRTSARVFVAARTLPEEGVEQFVNKLLDVSEYNYLRFVFILDNNAPEFPDNAIYHHVFAQDLFLSILSQGNWTNHASINDISISNENKIIDSVLLSTLSSSFSKTCKVTYIGLNSRELIRNDKPQPFEIGHLDYSGISASNTKIMGIAWTDLAASDAEPDPTFIWPVPENWTMVDAATVPNAYLLAYYVLFEVSKLKRGQSVLIHAGCTAFGLAAIRVAFSYDCTVYTTVATDEQRSHLKSTFPQLDEDNIMSSENTNFEWSLLWKRNGVGCDVIINCLPGDRIHASKRCAAIFSTLVQLGVSNDDEYCSTGSKIFLNNFTFYGILPESIEHLDNEVKARLHAYISDGITQGVVAPITTTIHNINEVDDVTRYLQSPDVKGGAVLNMLNESSLSKKTLYKCDTNGIYIIYGGNPDSWLNLVEWLTKRGAKTLLIVTTTHQNPNYINRRLTLINRIYSTNIIVTMEHAQTIRDLLTTAATLGLIKEIFVFGPNFESVTNTVNNINCITKDQKIVCLLENNPGTFYKTNNIVTIKWEAKRTFMDTLSILDEILQTSGQNFVLKNDHSLLMRNHKENDLDTFYPKCVEDIKLIGRNMRNTTTFIQLQSSCPKQTENVPPVFLIPGVSGFSCPHTIKFVNKLMSPVHGIQVASQDLDKDFATSITQNILKNHNYCLYNIIGIAFGGLIALEVAKCLESFGVQVQLSLIDCSPSILKTFTNVFSSCDNFKTKLLSELDITTDNSVDFEKGIGVLETFTQYSNSYSPPEKQFLGKMYSIQPNHVDSNDFGITQYCKKAKIVFIGDDHGTMLQDEHLIDFINENIEY